MATADVDELARPKPPAEPRREPKINVLFRTVMKFQASNLHLKVGLPPMMRLKGVIQRLNAPPLTQEQMEKLLLPHLTPRQKHILEEEGGVDLSYVIGQDECRFRVSLFRQRGRLGLVSRRVNTSIPT